jgi:ABC-type transporter Mla subunit MlaD
MPLQDLTPELRTRLSRVERTVGWFVIIATIILLAGFAYYLYDTAQKRGWFLTKINYATALNDFSGLKIGDQVMIMGFPAGEITDFSLNAPEKSRGVRVFFTVKEPYYQYIWYDSTLTVKSDLLKGPHLEISKGQFGAPTASTNLIKGQTVVLNRYLAYQTFTNLTNQLMAKEGNAGKSKREILVMATNELMTMLISEPARYYTNVFTARYTKKANIDAATPIAQRNYCWIPPLDAPTLEDRLGAVASQVEQAVPHFLALTNQLASVLSNANSAVAHLDLAITKVDPVINNLNTITGNLREPNGSLGNWLIPTNLLAQLHDTLHSATAALTAAHTTLDDADTNVTKLATDLDKTLEHLADLTGSLSAQVQSNSNLVSDINTTIIHTDDLVQGLKREWFLRGAFKNKKPKTNATNNAPLPAHQR